MTVNNRTSSRNYAKPNVANLLSEDVVRLSEALDSIDTDVAALQSKAPLASPALTGTPSAPTAAIDTNTTQVATTAFVLGQASAANPAINGTAAAGSSLRLARADHVHPTDTSRAPLASPTFTGTPAAPTPAADTNTTRLATTAFVIGQDYTKQTRTVFAGAGLTGGGDLSANRTISADVATQAEAEAGTSSVKLMTPQRTAQAIVASGPLAGFRNRIINGSFDIWQRGTSFSNPADNTYTADRWVVGHNGSGATRTVSQQIFNPGSTEAAPGSLFYLRHAQTVAGSGGTFNALNQRIESVRAYGGETVTLSFYARGTSAALTLPSIGLRQIFGTGGSADVLTTIASSIVIAGSTFARYTYTVTVPSISGKTVGTSSYLELNINLPLNNTFSLDIASVQLESGPVATPFEQRPIGAELALCQRYYSTRPTVRFLVYGLAANTISTHISFPTEMREIPNVTLSNVVFLNASAAAATNVSSGGFAINATPSSTAAASITATFTASAEL